MIKEKIKNYLVDNRPEDVIVAQIINDIFGKNYIGHLPHNEVHQMKIDVALALKELGYEMKLIKIWKRK